MITTIIQSVIASMTAISGLAWRFDCMEPQEYNINPGDAEALRPFALLERPIVARNYVDRSSGQVDKTFELRVALMQQSKLAWLASERAFIMDNMYPAEIEFLKKLLLQDAVQEITSSTSMEFINDYDGNKDGLLLTLQVKMDPEIFC